MELDHIVVLVEALKPWELPRHHNPEKSSSRRVTQDSGKLNSFIRDDTTFFSCYRLFVREKEKRCRYGVLYFLKFTQF